MIVNWWMFAGGLMAMSCAAGHAIAGLNMFYRPIKSAITNEIHAGILTGMWHLITIHLRCLSSAHTGSKAQPPGS
jgi:hypothetical protein